MLRSSRAQFLAVVALIACAPGPFSSVLAHAQTSSEIAAAKQWFSEGLKLETAGSWKDALDRFKRASSIKATPQIEFHLGLCESRAGDLVSAMIDLQRAVSLAREKNAPDVESAAGTELADVRTRAPTLTIDAPADRVQRLVVDGATVASAMVGSAMPMNPGEHDVVVEFANGRVAKRVTLAERDAKKVPFEPPQSMIAPPMLPPTSTPTSTPIEPATTAPARAESPPSEPHGDKTLAWLLVGGGGALVAGGVVFWILRGNESSTLDTACPTHTGCDPSLQSHYDSGKTDTIVALALGGAGLAAAAVGVGLLVTGGASSREAHAVLVPGALPGGGGASFVGTF